MTQGKPISTPMPPAQFWARIDRSSQTGTRVKISRPSGWVDVFAPEGHQVARWLELERVLYYLPAGETGPVDWPDPARIWPPHCPECGKVFKLKFRNRDSAAYWGCAWPVCEERRPFTLHPDEQKELDGFGPVDVEDWGLGAQKVSWSAQVARKRDQLEVVSMARVNGTARMELEKEAC